MENELIFLFVFFNGIYDFFADLYYSFDFWNHLVFILYDFFRKLQMRMDYWRLWQETGPAIGRMLGPIKNIGTWVLIKCD